MSALSPTRLSHALRSDLVSGVVILTAAVLAVVLANSGAADAYATLRDTRIGPSALHLDLDLGTWASDGLLAVFFFVVGVELAVEFRHGRLSDPRTAALPVGAAVGGMIVPALVFLAIAAPRGADLSGWAVPTATDIAFAVAVLAVAAPGLPAALRTFLLTLAVVDDLLAIVVIAVFYTDELSLGHLAAAVVPLGLFAAALRTRFHPWWLLLPLAAATWFLVHASGIHATIAGVLLGFVVPTARSTDGARGIGGSPDGACGIAGSPDGARGIAGSTGESLAERIGHAMTPLSSGVAVPVFAFFAAGVAVGGADGLASALTDPVALGIGLGLVVGKAVGVFGTTMLLARFTPARLDSDVAAADVAGIALLAGIGFTVSLLVGELAYGATPDGAHATVAVLVGSLVAAGLGGTALRLRSRRYARLP